MRDAGKWRRKWRVTSKASMNTSPREFTFCLVDTSEGVGHAFCSLACMASWIRFYKGSLKGQHLGYPRHSNACQYCWICGQRAAKVDECVLHHNGVCPEDDWAYTYGATHIAPIVSEVLGRGLTDYDMEIMSQEYVDRRDDDGSWDIAMRAVDRIRDV